MASIGYIREKIMTNDKDIVRRIIEEDGKFLVSFRGQPSYFYIPESAEQKSLISKLEQSKATEQSIEFSFDDDMNIVNVIL